MSPLAALIIFRMGRSLSDDIVRRRRWFHVVCFASACLLPNISSSDRIRRGDNITNHSGFSVPCLQSSTFFVCLLKLASINTWHQTHTHTYIAHQFIVFSQCLFSNRTTSDRCTKICSWFIALHTHFWNNSALSTVVTRCNEKKKPKNKSKTNTWPSKN